MRTNPKFLIYADSQLMALIMDLEHQLSTTRKDRDYVKQLEESLAEARAELAIRTAAA